MSKLKRQNWSKRTWLNTDATQTAFVSWEVEKETEEDTEVPWCSWGGVKIADCAKIVNLDFPLGKVSENRKSLKKIDKLISELDSFRQKILQEFDT